MTPLSLTTYNGAIAWEEDGQVRFVRLDDLTEPPRVRGAGRFTKITLGTVDGPVRPNVQIDRRSALKISAAAWEEAEQRRKLAESIDPDEVSTFLDGLNALRKSKWVTASDMRWLQMRATELGGLLTNVKTRGSEGAEAHWISSLAYGDRTLIDQWNAEFEADELKRFEQLFETVGKQPLTDEQRRACIRNDNRNLILAGAGTGKTTTLVARIVYLVRSEQASPEQILALTFNQKAAAEIRKKVNLLNDQIPGIENVSIRTFHSLGNRLHAEAHGGARVSTEAEGKAALKRWIDDQMLAILTGPASDAVGELLAWGLRPAANQFDFASKADYEQSMRARKTERVSLKGDIVKSNEELTIANWLFLSGYEYEYERIYEHEIPEYTHGKYTPDFYFPSTGLYYEHFALNRDDAAPTWFEKGYEAEAVRKRQLHARMQTRLIETRSYQHYEGTLLNDLRDLLDANGVHPTTQPDDALEQLHEFGAVSKLSEKLADWFALFREFHEDDAHRSGAPLSAIDLARRNLVFEILSFLSDRMDMKLAEGSEIDFSRMITGASAALRRGDVTHNYSHILVDEFQDLSGARSELLRALLDTGPSPTLFGVGDDWQSINRFAGSNISYITNFATYFGEPTRTNLGRTFRFGEPTATISSHFVQQNPSQLSKDLEPGIPGKTTELGVCAFEDELVGVRKLVSRVRSDHPDATILVLARNGREKKGNNPTVERLSTLRSTSRGKIEVETIHRSKGRTFDYVIVAGLNEDVLPQADDNDAIKESLRPPSELFPFAEERRLFYVAMTRAKAATYLTCNAKQPSPFIREIVGDHPELISFPFADLGAVPIKSGDRCAACGSTAVRSNKKAHSLKCLMCGHTTNTCRSCNAPCYNYGGLIKCANPGCSVEFPVCPTCGHELVSRRGAYGEFTSCSRFRGDAPGSCQFKTNTPVYELINEWHRTHPS